ncbi:hypothetical protein [Merismopedia glauca]|uniref:Uncharacterized protein n=1 Tax=Merismopedia glauca CCAP 1448/3 TaxID=1296344 RepID=A0A2T1C1R5_9CYAN|nr:hypothetical protein [Merismopedia glauca]PSB02182.1 hypothetical protein C7B64_14480 [Merismopedia glauca CCAP 1448/3]
MLSESIITNDEVERITGLEISPTYVSGVYRFKPFSSLSNFVPILINELLLGGLVIIFVLPVVAIALIRYTEISSLYLLLIGIFISILIYSIRWIYMYFKKQELRNTFTLLEQIDQHNKVVKSVEVIQQLSEVKSSETWLQYSSNIMQCLNTNRETLICGLMMDKIARNNKLSILHRPDLLATVENNLEFIISMSDRTQNDEYSYLINQVLTINLTVMEEMQNLKSPHL